MHAMLDAFLDAPSRTIEQRIERMLCRYRFQREVKRYGEAERKAGRAK